MLARFPRMVAKAAIGKEAKVRILRNGRPQEIAVDARRDEEGSPGGPE